MRQPAISSRLRERGIIVVASTAEKSAAMTAAEDAGYADVIHAANVPLN